MPRAADPALRTALVERAAAMVARQEPVTLRSLVAGAGVSTMAVYTYFGGMDGLWRAVRQEGFGRLAEALLTVPETDDPVRDLFACSAAYFTNAVTHPDLYRRMFDSALELEDPVAAADGFGVLIAAAERARAAGRFRTDVDPADVATRLWVFGHGLALLVIDGLIAREAVDAHVLVVSTALFVDAGDDPDRCRRSAAAGWAPGA